MTLWLTTFIRKVPVQIYSLKHCNLYYQLGIIFFICSFLPFLMVLQLHADIIQPTVRAKPHFQPKVSQMSWSQPIRTQQLTSWPMRYKDCLIPTSQSVSIRALTSSHSESLFASNITNLLPPQTICRFPIGQLWRRPQ